MSMIITVLNYFDLLTGNALKWTKLLILIGALLVSSILIGKKSLEKGYLEGIKFGFIFVLFLLIFNFLAFDSGIKLSNILFYFIMILTSSLGSMIGINRKKVEK